MDKKKSMLNVIIGVLFKVAVIFITLFSRRFLIQEIGNEANGIISLFTSIIGFLSIAELGIGPAIAFCMYKPIIDGDNEKVAALYNLFKKVYFIIGSIILVVGLGVTPLVKYMAKDYSLDFNIYLLYIFQLVAVVVSYFYSAYVSLINAYKNNYVTTLVNSTFQILKSVLQIVLVVLTKSLYLYMIVGIICEVLQMIVLYFYVHRRHSEIVTLKKAKIDLDTKQAVTKNIRALIMHKVGWVISNAIDNLVISIILGVVILGYYSNYITVAAALTSIISLIFQQLISVVGHAYYKNNPEIYKKYFMFFYLLNYFVATISFVCYFACINPFINLFFGENLLLDDSALFVITINYFVQFMMQSIRLFKDGAGLFYQDRFKCIFEATFNLALSIAFVYLIGVTGVILATIITNIFICHIVEPYVVYKYAFKTKITKYYVLNYCLMAFFVALLFAYYNLVKINMSSYELQFIVNGLIAALFSLPSFVIFMVYTKKNFNAFDRIKKILKK